MSIAGIQGYNPAYVMPVSRHKPSKETETLTEPVLYSIQERKVQVGGPRTDEPAAASSQRQQGFFGVGATDAQNGRSAWEPVGNLEVLNMQSIFLEMRSVPLDQGPGFIGKYIEELNQLAISR